MNDKKDYNPNDMLQWFEYAHLPAHLQSLSKPFRELAEKIMQYPPCEERSTALRKLLESKDAAVRSIIVQTNLERDGSPEA